MAMSQKLSHVYHYYLLGGASASELISHTWIHELTCIAADPFLALPSKDSQKSKKLTITLETHHDADMVDTTELGQVSDYESRYAMLCILSMPCIIRMTCLLTLPYLIDVLRRRRPGCGFSWTSSHHLPPSPGLFDTIHSSLIPRPSPSKSPPSWKRRQMMTWHLLALLRKMTSSRSTGMADWSPRQKSECKCV